MNSATATPSTPMIPYGTGWKLDPNVLSPSISISLKELQKNTDTTTLKLEHFKTYTESEIEDIKLESARLNQEEFDVVWPNYQRAWDAWVSEEEAAGRTIEEDLDLPACDSPRIKNQDKFYAYLIPRILRIVVVDFDYGGAKAKAIAYNNGCNALVPAHNNVQGPALLVDKHGEVFTTIMPCGRQLSKLGLDNFVPGPLEEEEDVVVASFQQYHKDVIAALAECKPEDQEGKEQQDEEKDLETDQETMENPEETKEQEKKKDYRYPKDAWVVESKKFYDAKGVPSTPKHFGSWPPKGMKHASTNTQLGPRNCVPTDDSGGGRGTKSGETGARIRNAVFEYQKNVLETETSCGAILKAVDPAGFETAREHPDELVEANILLRYSTLQNNPMHVAIGNAVSNIHRDEQDADECWAQTTTSGWYRDGAHVYNILGENAILSYRMRPGTIVLTKSKIIPHGISGFEGERYCNLFATKSDFTARQNIGFEEDEEEKRITIEKQREIDGKKADKKEKKRTKEVALIEAYKATMDFDENDKQSEDYFKLVHLTDIPNKLKVAVTNKNKAVKAAKEEGISTRKLKKLTRRPASLFYRFGKKEQERFDEGNQPFQEVNETKRGFHKIYKRFIDQIKARQAVLDSTPTARKRTFSSRDD
ncbi:hypothetical protein HYFRA_00002353 [Hymenoscyphus fraxineus]|uniref:Uncharacterized protein n=1 Tax=Hymenoscyphus fraxineus TaxID=746836 RepID=A0A9N9PV05_9HELO|nr:hypothetical protein HYFRA_00002353 [Hymenoscyphus fraxineus]